MAEEGRRVELPETSGVEREVARVARVVEQGVQRLVEGASAQVRTTQRVSDILLSLRAGLAALERHLETLSAALGVERARLVRAVEVAVGRGVTVDRMVARPARPVEGAAAVADLARNLRAVSSSAAAVETRALSVGRAFEGLYARVGSLDVIAARLSSRVATAGRVFETVGSAAYEMGTAFLYMIPVVGHVMVGLTLLNAGIRAAVATYRMFAETVARVRGFVGFVRAAAPGVRETLYEWYRRSGLSSVLERLLGETRLSRDTLGRMLSAVWQGFRSVLARMVTGWFLGGLRAAGQAVLTGATAGLSGLAAGLGAALSGLAAKVSSAGAALAAALATPAAAVPVLTVGLVAGLGKFLEAVGVNEEVLREVAGGLREKGLDLSASVVDASASLWRFGDEAKNWLSQNVPVIGGALGELAQGLIHGVAGMAVGFAGVVAAFEFVGDRIYEGASWLRDRIVEGASWLRDRIVEGASWVVSGVGWLRDRLLEGAEWVRGGLSQLAAWLGESARGVWDALSGFAGRLRGAFEEFLRDPIGSIARAVSDAGEAIRRAVTGFYEWLKGLPVVGDIVRALESGVRAAAEGVKGAAGGFSGFLQSLASSLGGLFDRLRSAVGGNPSGLVGALSEAMAVLSRGSLGLGASLSALGSSLGAAAAAASSFALSLREGQGILLAEGGGYTLRSMFGEMVAVLREIRQELADLRAEARRAPAPRVEVRVDERGRVVRYG